MASDARVPFGGSRQSGYGREFGIREFTNIKLFGRVRTTNFWKRTAMIKTDSNACLLRPETIAKHDRGGGASTTPLVTKGMGATGFITGFTEFAGGAKIPFHYHNCEESVMLIEGNALFDIDGTEFAVKPQDVTFIPAGVPHRFRNASETEPMKILWIYGSTEATRTLVATGETRTIAAEHAN